MCFVMWLLEDFRTCLKLALLDSATHGDPNGRRPWTPVEYTEICDFGDKGLCGKRASNHGKTALSSNISKHLQSLN